MVGGGVEGAGSCDGKKEVGEELQNAADQVVVQGCNGIIGNDGQRNSYSSSSSSSSSSVTSQHCAALEASTEALTPIKPESSESSGQASISTQQQQQPSSQHVAKLTTPINTNPAPSTSIIIEDTASSTSPPTTNISTNTTPPKTKLDPTIFIAGLSGVFLALQAAANSTFARSYRSGTLGTWVSLSISVPLLVSYYLITEYPTRKQLRRAELYKIYAKAPWWSWLSGPLGFGYVSSVTFVSGYLGAATFLGIAVSFQACAAVVMDHWGMLGMQVRRATWGRCVGAALLVVGAVMMTAF
jgi:transporter family-2 protein